MKRKGFTLAELIITMMLIVILSLIAMPMYKGNFSNNAKLAEGYALLGVIRDAQFSYFNNYGLFLHQKDSYGTPSSSEDTVYDPVLGISAASNKYFTLFSYSCSAGGGSDFDWRNGFTVRVFSKNAGSITRFFNLTKHFEPNVTNAEINLSV